MIKKILRAVGIFVVIVLVMAAMVMFFPLWMYMMVAFMFGTIGGATENGKLMGQVERIFWFIPILAIYCAIGWAIPVHLWDPDPLLSFMSWGWVRWAGVATLVLSFCALGGLEPGGESEEGEKAESVPS